MFERGPTRTRVHPDGALQLPGCVLTAGAFDGVHRGHQELIATAVRNARSLGLPAVVYTFDPPPKTLLCGSRPLTSVEDKLARISQLGPDHVIVASFDETYRARTASDFIREISLLMPQMICIGGDFRFGSCKRGDADLLSRYFDTRIVPAVRCETGEVVSSTRIRALKAAGRY